MSVVQERTYTEGGVQYTEGLPGAVGFWSYADGTFTEVFC